MSERRQRDVHQVQEAIPHVIAKLDISLRNLINIRETLQVEDAQLFAQCVAAHVKGDHVHAMMYANECAEIRRMALHVMTSTYALEQMVLRLRTVVTLGEVMGTMAPVTDVIQETGHRLEGIVPTIANQLNDASQILITSLAHIGTSQLASQTHTPVSFSAEAESILEDAQRAAEDNLRSQFPTIPQHMPEAKDRDTEALTS